jgi:hypothetical protein
LPQKQYNRQTIRQLVEAASNADGIENLAFDLFEEVYEQFSPEMTRSTRVRKIVDHAEKSGRIPDLLEYLKEHNPLQYNNFVSRLEKPEAKNFAAIPATIEERLVSIEEKLETEHEAVNLLPNLFSDQTKQLIEKIGSILLPEREQFEKDILTKRAEIAFDFSAKRYGIGYNVLDIECIINNDGSATIKRTSTILAYSTISTLDTYLLVPEPASSSQERDVGFLDIKSLSPDREVRVDKRNKDFQKSSFELLFAPSLEHGDECRFQMVEKIPSGTFAINLSMDELSLRKTSYDYFAWNINRPTRHLRMQVFIPESNSPDIYSSEVRYASASGVPFDKTQDEEQKRVRNPLRVIETGRCKLTLGVDYPMIGLIYMIRWEPKPIDG